MRRVFKKKGEFFLLFLFFLSFYLFFQLKSIYGGDSGDLVTAAWVKGVPHPPGYPFYTLLASFLVRFLHFSTPSWRVGLISSFSSALSLAVIYLILLKMIKKKWPALIASLSLGFLYPFWLYSEVAEVFSLNNLIILLLIFFFFQKQYFPFFFFLGLSFSHHHTVILIFPALIYLFLKQKKTAWLKKNWFKSLFLFLLGLIFYLYPPLACQKKPLVCWDMPVNPANFIRLVSRADYGIFRSSTIFGEAPILRVFSLLSAFRLGQEDFNFLSLGLILLGFYYFFRKNKDFFLFLTISLASFLFFLFYASYILVNEFMIGTFERFLIVPYIFLLFLLGGGIAFILEKSQILIKKSGLSQPSQKILRAGLQLILLILPFSFFTLNFKKISILKNDLTAENMINDFLAALPEKSILLVSSDTTVFDTLYGRYVLGIREDVAVLSLPLLSADFYQEIMKKNFPQLEFPALKERKELFEAFVKTNSQRFPVFVEHYMFNPPEDWRPYGLVWQYLPQNKQPTVEETVSINEKIWADFSDPLAGSLSSFKNLLLADVLRVYQNARVDYGNYLVLNNYLDEAENAFNRAEKLDPENEKIYIGLGAVFLNQGECEQAKRNFEKALSYNEKSALALGYLRKTALECLGDEEEAKKYEDQCVSLQEEDEVFLEDLQKSR